MPNVVPRSSEDEEGLKEHVLLGIIEVMNVVSAAQGLDNKVGVLLSNLQQLLGGTQTALYYLADDEWHYVDVLGQRRKLDRVEDDLVQRVFARREAVEQACAMALPLSVSGQLNGVIKLENNAPPPLGDLYGQLPLLLTHVATVLNQELKLDRAYERLSQAEEELRKSESRLRSYFELPLHGVAITSPEKGWIHVNQRLCSILGYSRSEIVRLTWPEMTHPDDLAEDVAQFERVLSGQIDQYQLEKRFVHKDGHAIWTRLMAGSVRKSDGTVECFVALVEDISERKRTDEVLRKSEEQLRLAQETAHVGVWDWMVETNTLDFTPELNQLYGLLPGTIKTYQDWRDLVHEDDIGRVEARRDEAITRHESFALEFRGRHSSKGYRWISTQGGAIYNEAGQAVRVFGVNIDITESKQNEEALSNALQHLNAHIDNSPLAVVEFDAQFRVVRWSEEAENVFGWTAEEAVGRSISEIPWVYEGDAERVRQESIALLSGEHTRSLNTNRNHRKDGSVIWCEWYNSGIFSDGKLISIQSLVLDITERKRMEEALMEAHEHLTLAQRAAGAGAWDWDMTTGRLDWSPELFRLFGLEGRAAPSFDLWRSVLHPDDRQAAEERMNMAIQSRLPLQNEYRVVSPTGEVRWISALGDTIYDEGGQGLRMAGICTDITRRKQAEEQLRITLESIEDGFFACDREWRFVYVNAPAEGMLGIRSAEVLGKCLWEVFPPTLGTPLELHYRRAAAGESSDFENLYEPWGRWFHNRCFPREDGGMAVYFQDITERKRLEVERETLEAQNRQLQKSESLGRMAGAIAHHFNNQLSVVMGNLELALNNLPPASDLLETLSGAMQGAQRAAELSGGMLTYLGQTPGKRELLDLSEILGRNLPLLKAAVPKGMELESAFPSPGPVVSANANQLQQLLTNLVTNAYEASSGEGGVVRLSVSQAAPAGIAQLQRFPIDSPLRHNAYACLEVADSGCGIASEDIERLFDPFFSTKFTGRGLGLAVVIGIVRAHEGVVTVHSEPGGGSTFRVYLPLMSQKIPRPAEPVLRPLEYQGTVLLVEDEEPLRRLAEKMLKGMGFTVLTARDGVEALEVFCQHSEEIRCVVCDLMMPHMDGWETLNALRKIAPGLAVVLSSGYSEEQVMGGDHPEMPQAFVCKPFLREQLGEAIGKALQG